MMLFTEELARARRATIWGSVVGLAALAALWLVLAAAGCATPPRPIPTPPVDPDAGPADLFDGAVVACDQWADTGPVGAVTTCLDVVNTAPCLVELYPGNTPDAIACTVRALSMRLHVVQAWGTATDDQLRWMAAADRWMTQKRVGYR